MSRMIIGVMPEHETRDHCLAIASGKERQRRGDPKLWFASMSVLAKILSDENLSLLKLIGKLRPTSVHDLALLAGCELPVLKERLNKLQQFGLVELRHSKDKVRPIAKATEFCILVK